jgi:hypothetical protein
VRTPDPVVPVRRVARGRIVSVDPRAPGSWEVPVQLPEPADSRPRALRDVVLAMALEAARLQTLFAGAGRLDDDRLGDLVRADRTGDLARLWRLAVTEVCAAYRVGALTAADAADRGEDDTFASLAALCATLLGWLAWCARLPFAAPGDLSDGPGTLPFRCAAGDGDPARTAVVAYTAVLATRR